MKFGPVPTAGAAGAILAHSVRTPGFTLRKGRHLEADDLRSLLAQGVEQVVVARLEPGDVHEDDAAARVAAAVAGEGVRIAAAVTGRVNLFARTGGLLRLDVARLHALNAVDESITLATLPPDVPVEEGAMLATLKIIPYAVPGDTLDRAVAAATSVSGAALRVDPWAGTRFGLVLTRLPDTRDTTLEKMRRAVAARLQPLRGRLETEAVVPHEPHAVGTAINDMLRRGVDAVLVSGVAATVDREDVIPAGIREAGGQLLHVGLPVDPGNLLLLARAGPADARRIVGIPTCARSPKLNGFDFVLQRLAVGDRPEGTDLVRLGVGGLLAEIPGRPAPRLGEEG